MKKLNKSFSFINFSFGFSTGALCSFFIIVIVIHEKFEKPWDTFWTTAIGFFGTIIGSIVGGIIAYNISLSQLKFQHSKETEKERLIQERYAERINEEILSNKEPIRKINELLNKFKNDFNTLAIEISKGNTTIIEGITLFSSEVEIDTLNQLRTQLFDIKYAHLHKRIDRHLQIKQLAGNIRDQNTPDFIEITLGKLLNLTENEK
ncbi:hypothetical protein CHH83_05825 [Bacillus sp. 7586-K]|nr:hypothetical protein CHH83_05825 [Bacillus sp. 7586-K]